MANYNLVVNSKFQPFSFERYIQPYQIYGQAYKELENQYAELDTKASIWEEMANEQTDPYAYKMYKTYANDLENKAGQLAREGLNATSRKDMLNMRARYSKEITPIEQAYTARQKQAEEQQKALLQDPTLMLSRRAATTSLDDYIRNPQLAYDSYSGKLITAQVAQAAGALSKEMRDNPRKWRSILGNSYYETVMQKGFSSDAVLQAIQNSPDAAPELLKIVENAVNSSGVRKWGDEDIIDSAYDYARLGLWGAVGETQYQILDDWRAKMAEQEAMKAIVGKGKDGDLDNGIALRGTSYIVSSGMDAEYYKSLLGLKAGTDSFKASVMGRKGGVNILKVYEEYHKAEDEATEAFYRNHNASSHTTPYVGSYAGLGKAINDNMYGNHSRKPSLRELKEEARQKVLEKYGVTEVISNDQYEALKAIGYTGEEKRFSQLMSKLNDVSQYKTYFSTNMSDYSYADDIIRGNMGLWENNNSFSGRVYSITKNGKQGGAVDYSDLNLYDPQSNNDGRHITDISYDVHHPKKIIIQVGESGERYLVDPNVLGSEVSNMLDRSSKMINDDNKSDAAYSITTAIANILNSYNPVKSKTSTHAGE